MDYKIGEDLSLIRELFNLSQDELAKILETERITIARTEIGESYPREEFIDKFYDFCYKKGLRLNIEKEMFYKDDIKENHKLLTHASKSKIDGEISINKGRTNTDFKNGFYCSESYEKSIPYVARFPKASVYFIDFDPNNLKPIKFNVDLKWMLTIAYFRGKLDEYKNTKSVKKVLAPLKDVDYIVAPIADNRMFDIIDTFINGEITDEQAKHSLASTNLGYQYVFISDKSIKNLKIIERCFVSTFEKEDYKKEQIKFLKIGNDKSKIARIEYKNKGKYIGEILK
jgi:transcriptional regulator with XRE-family HTH domain